MAASTAETQPGMTQEIALPVNSATAPNNNGTPKRASEGMNRTGRKQDTSDSKLLQRANNAQSDTSPQPSKMGDSPAPKVHELTQPTPATLIHDDQNKPTTPASAVSLAVERAAPTDPNAKDGRPLAVSADPSPAENAQAAPVVVQSARVLERMGQSEMRLGLNSSNFGIIELRTSLNQDRVGASIATSHAELRAAMMAEMPSLERAIAQHQLRLDSLHMDSGPGAQTGNGDAFGGNPSGARTWNQSAAEVFESSEDSTAQETSPPQAWIAPYPPGLNVHA